MSCLFKEKFNLQRTVKPYYNEKGDRFVVCFNLRTTEKGKQIDRVPGGAHECVTK